MSGYLKFFGKMLKPFERRENIFPFLLLSHSCAVMQTGPLPIQA